MYYLIYKITNKINGKFYVGKHKTDIIEDGYLGSGKLLWLAYKKYGIDNFKKEILKECLSEDEMNAEERKIVDLNFVKREDTYNCAIGGKGGYPPYSLWSEESKHKFSESIKCAWRKDKARGIIRNNGMRGKIWIKKNDERKNDIIDSGSVVPDGWSIGKWPSDSELKNHCSANKGMRLIRNIETNDVTYISKEEKIPSGWALGGKSKGPMSEEQKQKLRDFYMIKRQNSADDNYKKFKPLYDVYIKEGFPAVKEKFGYKFTPVNLVRSFNRYIPEFQQTKKQGKRYDLKNG